MSNKRTWKTDKNGREIMVGDTLEDANGIRATVFHTTRGFRVAPTATDAHNGHSAALGIFLIGGAVVVEENKTA